MPYQGVLDDVKSCVKMGMPSRIPVFALTEEFDVAQAGISYERYSKSAETAANVHINAIKAYDYDWAMIYIDDCLEFEPMGVVARGSEFIPRCAVHFVDFPTGRRWTIKKPDPYADGRMPVLLQAQQAVRRAFGDTVFICGRTPAPFSAATLLYGLQPVMLSIYDHPSRLYKIMQVLAESALDFAKAQKKAGADAVWVGDCSASSRFLSLVHFDQIVYSVTKKMIDEIRALGLITIYFAAETSLEHGRRTFALGADVVGLGEHADMKLFYPLAKDHVCLMGNLDPMHLMHDSDPMHIAHVTRSLCNYVQQGGWLFNTGEGVPRQTPKENVHAMVRAIRMYDSNMQRS